MLLYYVPTVDQAYAYTLFIIEHVPLGRLIETVHLYSAYAMVLLAFAHLMRGYFASVQKKPREMMWVIGMLMGLVVLAFGLTGYLLSWTVVSKSATDVTIGMLSFLPAELAAVLRFLIVGAGSDPAELSRFFDLHVVVLPAVLLALLAWKMYMFEVHGASKPATGLRGSLKQVQWFPDIFLFLAMISAAFLFLLFGLSALFPLTLPAAFTPAAAAVYVPQPEWYFLWIYQILKFSVFEGVLGGVPLTLITLAFVLILLLPFIDRGHERNPVRRPLYITLGVIIIVELGALSAWGYFTLGQVIPNSQATVVTAGIAISISIMSWITYTTRKILRAESSSRNG
jgi:quinol-cytochrome oxidoreductase complex cytochrome b subunit